MPWGLRTAAWVSLLLVASCDSTQDRVTAEVADTVLTGGRIYTVDVQNPWASAVAIKDGRFMYVGDDRAAERYIGASTTRVDLAGRMVLPGLIDSHTHPGMIGIERYGPPLPETSRADILAAVKAYADTNPPGKWIRMCCWPNTLYIKGREGPNKRDLDAIVPNRPVWITSTSWHSYWLNSKGLEMLGVDRNTPDPKPGIAVYVRDESGELTGWIKEGAGWQHFTKQFEVDPDLHRKSVEEFLATLSEHGVTTVFDGGNNGYEDQTYSLLAQLDKEGKLPLRYEGTWQIFLPERRFLAVQEMKRLRKMYGSERLRFRTIKLFMDGINSNRTGSMLSPYADVPDYVGTTMLSADELRDFLLELHKEKFDLHIHTIGDLAVRTALDAVEAAQKIVGPGFYPRVTLAHLQVVDPADWPRFGELGVTANFTPWWHGVSANDPAAVALGEERFARTYIAKPLIDSGANVTFSSDDWVLPVLSPFLGMEVGHNRRFPDEWLTQRDGDPEAFRPPASERLDLDAMVRGYTLNGAYPLRMEADLGSITVGKIADLVVLDQNLFEVDRFAIHDIKPVAVMMAGEFLKKNFP